jgi:hypothetical protein
VSAMAAELLLYQCHPLSHPAPALAWRRQDASMPPEPPTPSPAYQRLRRFISERMRMSHIYQPLML